MAGVSTTQLLDILEGRAPVTPAVADRIGLVFGTSAEVWLNLQAGWDAWQQGNASARGDGG